MAIIDVALRDGPCTELANTLRRLNVPFLVHSGRQQDRQLTRDV
ncbi:hypothetical protein [Methylobacterium sp. CM6246]